MNATKKFRMLSSLFIVLGLLLSTSFQPTYAQGRGEENAAAPEGQGIRLRQILGQVSSLSGWFSIIWGDSRDGESSMVYTLTDVNGKRTLLQLDERVVRRLGGVLQFNGKFVTVQGTLPTPSGAGATPDFTQGQPAVLNVISISLAPSPGSNAPAIDGVTPLAAVTGSRPWVTIMCKFSDITAEPNDLAYFQGMYGDTKPGLNHYWKELSFNTANVDGSTTGTGWYTLPHTESYYNPTDTEKGTDRTKLANDCIGAADATVNFSLYSGINMMFNSDFDNGWAWGGGWTDTLDGVTKTWSITWEPPWAYHDISVIAHEMGHGFGLPHSSYDRADVYDNAWDVMSWDRYHCAIGSAFRDATYGCMAQHTISYHKDLLGWIPGARKITVPDPVSATTLTLEDLAAPASANYQIAIIPIGVSGTNFYTVEARQFTGYDAKLPGEAVIIHNVDTTNGIPAVLVPGGLSGGSTDEGVRFIAGEKFHDATNHITVKVNSATATGFEVTILNGNNPPTSKAGGPYTQQCTGPTTTVALDGSGSSDPEGFSLTYSWSTTCPGGTFDNATLAKPKLTVNTSPGCGVICTVSLIVTDNQGLPSGSDSAIVSIRDTVPPNIVCPASRTIECSASSAPSNTGFATSTDGCTPTPTVTWADFTTPGSCPQASTISRTWTATDNCLNAASCAQTIHIVDTTPPVLSPRPADVTLECDAAVPAPPTVTATDNCDPIVPTSFNEQRINGNCPSNYTLKRTWSATDDCGNTATHLQTITVQDTRPPVIWNVGATPNVLWPPNHKMVQVKVTATATDNCDSAPHCRITSVSSSEPVNGPGDGDTAPDWDITGDLTVDLRAERSGTGKGRIYVVTVTCTDACGNSSVGSTTVRVPHDQNKK